MKRSRSMPDTIEHEELLVHDWRAMQRERVGIPWQMLEARSYRLDWHQVAALVRRGCLPVLALRIVR